MTTTPSLTGGGRLSALTSLSYARRYGVTWLVDRGTTMATEMTWCDDRESAEAIANAHDGIVGDLQAIEDVAAKYWLFVKRECSGGWVDRRGDVVSESRFCRPRLFLSKLEAAVCQFWLRPNVRVINAFL